ncbi:THAP domain-containing protein 4 isoform X2 [Pseudonaja textilis]|uniref:THAP domain-containing protein 4 isoform X2 n=1 Tax=Notechis scutatus TaxID=8663 RepID=A0A6J1W5P9_9SAUR|nr:THAP domain-containing protein 4 isoform X2 [Notechis scutatus]XP_026557230.1 THAP domain-containing protein 4 isoform X2 [Pseudonaja textilis]
MVICCAALNCSNRQGKGPRDRVAVSFHRFPLKDSKRLIQWLKAVQRDNWIPTKYSFLCSEHFTKDSFSKRLEDQHRFLKPTAIPSIFHISEPRGNSRGYLKRKRKIITQTLQRNGNQSNEGSGEVVEGTLSSGQDLLVEGTNNMEHMTLQAEIGSMTEQGENFQVQLEGSLRRMLADNLVTKVTQHKPENHSVEDHSEVVIHPGSFKIDKNGISEDDFTPPVSETAQLNPVIEPLSWMLGTWLSDPPGDGTFPSMKPFQYLEEVHISHVGQPMLNFSFNAFHPDTKKPMHRECGFIRIQPDTNKVAFISAQNTGLVEVEEGEVNGQELSIASNSVARISFAKKPHVEQITRKFRLNSEGKLEQTVSMSTTTQPMTQHLHITYKKVIP